MTANIALTRILGIEHQNGTFVLMKSNILSNAAMHLFRQFQEKALVNSRKRARAGRNKIQNYKQIGDSESSTNRLINCFSGQLWENSDLSCNKLPSQDRANLQQKECTPCLESYFGEKVVRRQPALPQRLRRPCV